MINGGNGGIKASLLMLYASMVSGLGTTKDKFSLRDMFSQTNRRRRHNASRKYANKKLSSSVLERLHFGNFTPPKSGHRLMGKKYYRKMALVGGVKLKSMQF